MTQLWVLDADVVSESDCDTLEVSFYRDHERGDDGNNPLYVTNASTTPKQELHVPSWCTHVVAQVVSGYRGTVRKRMEARVVGVDNLTLGMLPGDARYVQHECDGCGHRAPMQSRRSLACPVCAGRPMRGGTMRPVYEMEAAAVEPTPLHLVKRVIQL